MYEMKPLNLEIGWIKGQQDTVEDPHSIQRSNFVATTPLRISMPSSPLLPSTVMFSPFHLVAARETKYNNLISSNADGK